LNRPRAFRAIVHAAAASICVISAARAVEAFRLMEWPAASTIPSFHLVDVNHAQRTVADYRGRVLIVLFGFTHCPDICPSELFKLSLVVQRLGFLAPQVQVLFISLDPERDTPELLKTYVTAIDRRFIGLTGSSAAINEAAASFSIQFAKVPQGIDYTINHSTGTYVLDKTGRLRLVGTMKTQVDDFVHDLTILATD
jgi:protein SCO1